MLKSNFKISFFLPICKKKVYLKEISNYYYIDLLKFIQNDKPGDIEEYFDFLINELTDICANHLCNIDKFYILLELRALSLGSKIELSQDNINFKINLESIIKKISDIDLKNKIFSLDGIEYEISLPYNLYHDNIDILYSSISKIDGNLIKLTSDTKIVDLIPSNIFKYIKEFILNANNKLSELVILEKREQPKIEEWLANPYNNSLFDFLKLIYADNLMNFYEMQFNLITKMHVSYDHFMSMTYNESKLFINLQNREIKKQEEATNTKNSGIPLGR
jgi:hypothetical protein